MLAQLNVNKTRTTDATLNTVLRGTEYITNKYGTDMRLAVGTDLKVGEIIAYRYEASDGGYYAMCSPAGSILKQETFDAKAYQGTCGGSFVVDGSCGSVVFGKTLSVRRDVVATVEEIITSVTSLADLYDALDAFNVNNEMLEDIVYMYLDNKAGSGRTDGPGTPDNPGTPDVPGGEEQQIEWEDILNTPDVFPPDEHGHQWADIADPPMAYPPEGHRHSWYDVDDVPDMFPPASHTHEWDDVLGKPGSYPPSSHGHTWGDISNKPSTYTPSSHTHTWGEISGKPSTYPPSSHTHDDRYFTEAEINSKLGGYMAANKIVTGTYVYNGAATTQFSFTNAAVNGKGLIICGTQDAGNAVNNASISGSTITVRVASAVSVMRVNYICF